MADYFISDLHLSKTNEHIPQIFLNFLAQLKKDDHLFILGDFFDLWLGDDASIAEHSSILQQLKKTTEHQIEIFFQKGNHDFLVREDFFQISGCQLLEPLTTIKIAEKTALLLHGDELCIDDLGHQFFRKEIMLNEPFHHHFLSLPIPERIKIAMEIKQKSREACLEKSNEIMDINDQELKRIAQQFSVDIIIHGHTHRPSIHYFNLPEKPILHVVLSDWHTQGNVLIYDQNSFRLSYFNAL